MANVKFKRGLARIGILLSIIWIIVVAGVAMHEADDKRAMCAITPDVRGCHHFFYTWQRPSEDEKTQAQDDTNGQGKQPGHLSLNIGKMHLEIDSRAPVYKLDPEKLLLGLFGPLAALWFLGLGLSWCADGFKEKA